MDLPTQTHLKTLRNLLNFRLQELRAEVHAAEKDQQQRIGDLPHEVMDRKDEASDRLRSDLDGVQEQRDLDEMAQVEAALQRLDAGTYGDCVDCGESISLKRLQVQPAAQRCAPCQVAFEKAADRS